LPKNGQRTGGGQLGFLIPPRQRKKKKAQGNKQFPVKKMRKPGVHEKINRYGTRGNRGDPKVSRTFVRGGTTITEKKKEAGSSHNCPGGSNQKKLKNRRGGKKRRRSPQKETVHKSN